MPVFGVSCLESSQNLEVHKRKAPSESAMSRKSKTRPTDRPRSRPRSRKSLHPSRSQSNSNLAGSPQADRDLRRSSRKSRLERLRLVPSLGRLRRQPHQQPRLLHHPRRQRRTRSSERQTCQSPLSFPCRALPACRLRTATLTLRRREAYRPRRPAAPPKAT